jgi:GrpB-like predicted nucleotidyltransferase (UPF0157 family)
MELAIMVYRDVWPRDFAVLAARVRAALGSLALRVDHIGSTAVPGLASKDRIDVQVTVATPQALDAAADALAAAGFLPRPAITSDHVPAGSDSLPERWVKRFVVAPPHERPANIHIRVAGMPNQRYALLFRDYLRAHPQSAAAYGELKRRLAANLADLRTYADVKDPACDLIAVAAESWAMCIGWQPGPSDVATDR